MDEAEYCGRVGIMREGKLLAWDTPSALKETALSGLAWDVYAQPLLPALAALQRCPCVLRSGLVGDHLRAISHSNSDAQIIQETLQDNGVLLQHMELAEPTLEDVFLALAMKTS
jgi:ABC-2 type transport system ATP-binding protein